MVRADEATRPGSRATQTAGPKAQGTSRMVNVWQHDEGEALPVTSDEKGPLSITRRRKRVAAALLASGMGNTVTANGPRPRLRSIRPAGLPVNGANGIRTCWGLMASSRPQSPSLIGNQAGSSSTIASWNRSWLCANACHW
jgi:hypothetical protein